MGGDEFMVLVLFLNFVQVDAQLGHCTCDVLSPDFHLVKVLTEIKVGGTDLLRNLLAVHVAITEQWDHVETLRRGEMDPLERTIQDGGAVSVLDCMPTDTPFLKRCDPVVVVASVFLDGVDHYQSASNRNQGKNKC